MKTHNVALLAALALAACAAPAPSNLVNAPLYTPGYEASYGGQTAGAVPNAPTASGVGTAGERSDPAGDPLAPMATRGADRRVIHEASITVRVKDVQAALLRAGDIAREADGFVLSSEKSGEGSASLVLRVPDPELEPTLERLASLGVQARRSVRGQDVTEEYADLKIRLATSEQLLLRYKELMAKADKVEAMLAIENEIGRVTRDIETLKGKLIYLDDRTTLATVTVSLQKKRVPGPIGAVFYGAGWLVSKLFVIK
jgi:hypothetical protein